MHLEVRKYEKDGNCKGRKRKDEGRKVKKMENIHWEGEKSVCLMNSTIGVGGEL